MISKIRLSSLKTNTLYETTDYLAFALCNFNRSVNKTKELRESMLSNGFIASYPMHVRRGEGGSLLIVGGHHRFTVAKELGIGVWFIVTEDDASIHELERATNQWSLHDYLDSYARTGIEPYVIVKEYCDRTGINLSIAISLLAGEAGNSNNWGARFKNGEMEIRGKAHAEQVANIVSACQLLGIAATRSHFTASVSRCLCVKEFCVDTFLDRARVNASMLTPQRSLEDQMRTFETVYNFKALAANRLPLAFLADRAMTARNAVAKNAAKVKK